MLSAVKPHQCLRIPTFQNDDLQRNMESFKITISPSLPVTIQNFVEVRIFEQCVTGDLRLVNGSTEVNGRVELCSDGIFGTICDVTPWTTDDASVVCQQLGLVLNEGTNEFVIYLLSVTDYPQLTCSISELPVPSDATTFGVGFGPFVAGSFLCQSDIFEFLRCISPQTVPLVCLPNTGVFCRDELVICTQGSVRLVKAETSPSPSPSPSPKLRNEGRVEYCNANQWGTVCNNEWNSMDAAVVCRQLNIISGSSNSNQFILCMYVYMYVHA